MNQIAGLITGYRLAWGAANRGQWFLVAGFIFAARILAFNVAFPLYAKAQGFDASRTGLLLAAVAISLFIFGAPIMLLNARGLGRRLLIGGPLVSAAGVGIILLSPGAYLAPSLVGCLLAGMAGNVFWVMGDPLLAGATAPDYRPQVFAMKFALLTVGFAVGGLLGGWIPQILSIAGASDTGMYAGALMLVILLDIVQSCCYWRIPHEQPDHSTESRRADRRPARFTGIAFWVVMLLMLVPEMGMATGFNSIRPYLSLFFDEVFGLSAGSTGTAVSLMQLAGGISALLIPSLAKRWGSVRTMGLLRLIGGTMVVGAIGAPALPLVLLFFFVHYTVVDGTGATFVSEAMERLPGSQRATFAAVSASVWSVFSAIATSVSGFLQDATGGFELAFGMGAVAYFISASWLFFVFPRLPPLLAEPDVRTRLVAEAPAAD